MDKTLEISASIADVISRFPLLTFWAAVFLLNLAVCAWALSRESLSQRLPKLRRALRQSATAATLYIPLAGTSLITKALGPMPHPMLQSLQEAATDSVLFLGIPTLALCFWARWRLPVGPTSKQDEGGAFLAATDEQ